VATRMLQTLEVQLAMDNPNLPEDLKGHYP
jgi:hypothetical protein